MQASLIFRSIALAATLAVLACGCRLSGKSSLTPSEQHQSPAPAQSLSSQTPSPSTAAAPPPVGKTYYLASAGDGGNDTNSGLSPRSPWLSPYHQLNCGDIIRAKAGSYNYQNFYTGKWGRVNCPANNNVAWLICETFDACKIFTTVNQGMWVDQSYWGVQGWEITTSASDQYGTCFIAQPNWVNPVEIHHIIFANDVANGCSQSGFAVVNHGAVSVDYFAVLGTIAYNTSQGSGTCASGITIYQPVQSDSLPGTHLYVAGNFSYANVEPPSCNGTPPTDGEGIIFDTFDGSQGSLPTPYAAQTVAENNLILGNGGKGIEVSNNSRGAAHATIYIDHNTVWGNLVDPNQAWMGCGEISLNDAYGVHITANLVSTSSAKGCSDHPIFAVSIASGDSTDTVSGNFLYGFSGNHTFVHRSGFFSVAGDNVIGRNPQFAHAGVPGPPQCHGAVNAPACMASTVADFRPTDPSAIRFGYQPSSPGPASDPLFPQWLCNTHLPPGLVTTPCSTR